MLRHLILSASILFLGAPSALAEEQDRFDAVVAAPQSHRILLENDKIRVLRVSIAPGATEPIHDHRWPSVMYFEQPQPISYISYNLVDGTPVETSRVDAPAIPTSMAESAGPEGLHAVQNRGTAPFLALRVEFKDGRIVE